MSIHRIPWTALERIDGKKGGRTYTGPEGQTLVSVTNYLSVIGKPALVNWAANTERELVVEAAANLYLDTPLNAPRMKRDAYVRTLLGRIGAEKAHQRIVKKATDVGGEAHKLIEWNLRKELGQEAGPEPRISPDAATAFAAYETWWRSSGLKPLRVEQVVFHPGELYAGTLDLLAELDGELVVVDFKTSKAIYQEYPLQVAAYAEAVNAMGHGPIRRGIIVRFPKDKDTFNPSRDIHEVTEIGSLFEAFKHVMALWRWQNDKAAPQAPATEERSAAGNGAEDAAA